MSITKHIRSIGIELEGTWHHEPDNLKGDGSVRHTRGAGDYDGEVASDPFTSRSSWPVWVKQNYPNGSNQSCGLHVHMKPDADVKIGMLMDEEFQSTLLQGLESYGERNGLKRWDIWANRISGGHEYCRREWRAELSGSRVNRYLQVNFSSYELHGTVEFRLLPMFPDSDAAVGAITEMLRIVDEYLESSTNKPTATFTETMVENTSPEVIQCA